MPSEAALSTESGELSFICSAYCARTGCKNPNNGRRMNPYNLNFAIRSKLIRNSIKLANTMAAIYIHVPFCRQACHYCNFHFSTNLALQNDFIAALLKEIEWRADYLNGEPIETIYFGGGTPSLLPVSAIAEIVEFINSRFTISQDPEITLELNPDDMSADLLTGWKLAGINRLSIGVQSFFTDDLLWMNRTHDADQAIRAISKVRYAGFDNYSLDMIYG